MANPCPNENFKGELVLKEKGASISVAGLFGAFLFLVGVLLLFFSTPFGVLMVIVGLLIGYFGRGKQTYSVCPVCGYRKKLL